MSIFRQHGQVSATFGRASAVHRASAFDRACAVLCLLLLLFSLGHATVGHSDAFNAASLHGMTPTVSQQVMPTVGDTADACALCVALSTVVVLAIFAFGVPSAARLRPSLTETISSPLTAWHASLSCRPPPAR